MQLRERSISADTTRGDIATGGPLLDAGEVKAAVKEASLSGPPPIQVVILIEDPHSCNAGSRVRLMASRALLIDIATRLAVAGGSVPWRGGESGCDSRWRLVAGGDAGGRGVSMPCRVEGRH